MARAKKPKPKMLTLEEQLAEHRRDAPIGPVGDAYDLAYRREYRRKEAELRDAIRHRDAKRIGDATVEVTADDPEATRKSKRNDTKCAISQAFIHRKLDTMQREAMAEMDKAYRVRCAGVGPARSNYGPRNGRGGAPENATLEQAWLRWCADAVEARIMVPPVMDILFEVMTLGEVERKHRMRRGQALDQLISALHLWAQLRGWVKGPRMQAGPHLVAEHAN